jgi:gamma-glutamylaminecyclotransferase
MSDQRSHRIFVYGSLKRGFALSHLLNNQQFLGQAVTQPLYRIFDLGSYPGLVEWPEGISVRGEVYAVTTACLRRLDDAEGVSDGCYARREVLLQTPWDGYQIEAWFWLGRVSGLADCGECWPGRSSEAPCD